jgi:D-glycero-D-manno-heptose 1,7-bisphosphate phosphatase
VLNRATVRGGRPFPPRDVQEVEILPGVVEACQTLRDAGFLLIVVTNQPDVARGTMTLEHVAAVHARLNDKLPLDAVLVCVHDDHDRCRCRKPAPGLLLEAGERFHVALEESVMIGDRWRDIEAGRRAGCRTVFVDGGYSERLPEGQDMTVGSLAEAVPWILAQCVSDRRAT